MLARKLTHVAISANRLYRHIFLGGKESFITQYRLEREEQASLLFKIPKKRKKSNINFAQLFADFLTQILGFFAVEDFVHHSTRNSLGTPVRDGSDNTLDTLVSRTWLERQLLTAVSKVVILIRTENSDECRQLVEIKKLILAFSKSLGKFTCSSVKCHQETPSKIIFQKVMVSLMALKMSKQSFLIS